MTDEFKHCRALGLEVECTLKAKTVPSHVVAAETIEALFAKGVRIKAEKHETFGWSGQEREDAAGDYYTHTALLIGITEIRKETAEDVLRDFLAFSEKSQSPFILNCVERARRVLEENVK